jgi:hypothetical protein
MHVANRNEPVLLLPTFPHYLDDEPRRSTSFSSPWLFGVLTSSDTRFGPWQWVHPLGPSDPISRGDYTPRDKLI